jgi:Spy/CpxP family protein refolding chaperone
MASRRALLMLVALAAGALVGFAGSSLSYHQRWFRPPGERPFDRMSRSLALSDTQRRQLHLILEETKQELNQARLDYESNQRRLMVKAYLESRAMLTPEQQAKFDRKFVPHELQEEARATGKQQAIAASDPNHLRVTPATSP